MPPHVPKGALPDAPISRGLTAQPTNALPRSATSSAPVQAREHVSEIERVLSGAITSRDLLVAASWQRCIVNHRLDPTHPGQAYILPNARLREHRQRSENLIRTARSGLETLHRQMAEQGYVLLLSDDQGVTVDFIGDPAVDEPLRKAGLYLGAEWSEARAGTCAVGSCLATGEALTIHQSDHFDLTHTPLTCSASPIYDLDGSLAAVLDISALRSPEAKVSQSLAFHLVAATTRRIELANLMACSRAEWVLRFSRSPEFLDVDPEGAVAIDGSGRVVGMTNAAQRLLAAAIRVDWRTPAGIIGRSIGDFFGLDLNDLPNLMHGNPTESRLVVAQDGNTVFAHAIAPQPTRARHSSHGLPQPLAALSGGDLAMDAVLARAARLAPTALPILLQGETGSGKEVLARAIHRCRQRPGEFIAINCAALPESLIEGELFGHAPSAFTGAAPRGRKGLIEAADGGTLFLDEIGDMSLALQTRLLRVLAEREIVPVGSMTPVPVDLRIISATHRDLSTLVREGRFREDLFYRLNAAVLSLPPLRQRDDLPWLIEHFLRAGGAGSCPALEPAASAALLQHPWPGNVRELANTLNFALALAESGVIRLADLPQGLQAGNRQASTQSTTATLQPTGLPVPAVTDDLRQVLVACRWNVSEAARRLGLDRTTVHRRMRRLDIHQPQ